ncbi:guanine nucleotide-binding protein-like 1 isoform X2 [Zophobas morio]|uniref:guanine nucleotide-binding protein-like 1 isoform X2 n=1 Tax=Zophobas morio TaxID=2755281 RepID=UPI003083B26D
MPRKKPYSGKAKKLQLRGKKEEKRRQTEIRNKSGLHSDNLHQGVSKNGPNSRFSLHFIEELLETIEENKIKSRLPYSPVAEEELEFGFEDVHGEGTMSIPLRPRWNYDMTKEELEKKEQAIFKIWMEDLTSTYKNLSYFELNLENWRQLWRVLEISNVILLITDVRHPIFHFSPALFNYIVDTLQKPVILVLNKIDLVSEVTCRAWKEYFQLNFPKLHVVMFASFPREQRNISLQNQSLGKAWGVEQLLQACCDCCCSCESFDIDKKSLIIRAVKDWNFKVKLAQSVQEQNENMNQSGNDKDGHSANENTEMTIQHDPFFITIGLVGSPNVGKSSIINALVNKKVVSCSRTPGHTKHFQTIYVTPLIRVCDSPGIVFPTLLPRCLQILSGVYPVSQVREPYSSVQFLAERVPLVRLLGLTWPYEPGSVSDAPTKPQWSAWAVCDAWAKKRGFHTAKAGRLDTYRAANNILRLAVEGHIVLSVKPLGFYQQYSTCSTVE